MGAKMENPSDPPLIGCVTGDAASGYVVSITNNRGYSMVLTPPKGLIQLKREYAGFEQYVQSTDLVAKAIGGPYIGKLSTVSYNLPATGGPYTFTGAISLSTAAVDLATALFVGVFDSVIAVGTFGYAKCILDNVAHSGAATLDEAPKLVAECIPGVGVVFEIRENLKEVLGFVWSQEDKVFDTALNIHPRVDVTPAPPVIPEGLKAAPASATSARLDWADKSSIESGYRVYLNDKALPAIRPANSTSTVVTELKPETKYCFAVEAVGAAGGSGKSTAACATTPSLPVPDLSTWTGFELGKLYRQPHFPSIIGIDNHNYLSELVWSEIGKGQAVATGNLLIDNCIPDCAQGTYVKHRAEVVASQPMTCNVPVAVTYSDKSKDVEAYVYSVITVRDLGGSPDLNYVGNDVILTGCSASVPR
jgi:hypothetical protein